MEQAAEAQEATYAPRNDAVHEETTETTEATQLLEVAPSGSGKHPAGSSGKGQEPGLSLAAAAATTASAKAFRSPSGSARQGRGPRQGQSHRGAIRRAIVLGDFFPADTTKPTYSLAALCEGEASCNLSPAQFVSRRPRRSSAHASASPG